MKRVTFIGLGESTGNLIQSDTKVTSYEVARLLRRIGLNGTNVITLGLYKGEDGLYLEQAETNNRTDFKELFKEYPKEEAFFRADVYGYQPIPCEDGIYAKITEVANKLDMYEGCTFKVTQEELNLVLVDLETSELITNKKYTDITKVK